MITLPSFFSDGMVMGLTARIWGWAEPGERVEVSLSDKRYETVANPDGRFDAVIESGGYGGPHTMKIGEREIRDVYIGRVWLCGGQSNMETPLGRTRPLLEGFIADDGRIRIFQGEKGLRFDGPARDVKGEWRTAEGKALDDVYAVPYFFARALLEKDPSPIGLIAIPAGGTPIEGWLPEELIRDYPALHASLLECRQPGYMDEAVKTGNERVGRWHEQLNAGDVGLAEGWHSPDYDDGLWESKMLLDPSGNPEHGSVWYRKKFTLPEAVKTATLYLGRVENCVKVYVNGQWVNSVDYMYPPCVCDLPEGLLKAGENLIAVQVVGDSLPPSFVPDKRYEIIYGGNRVELNCYWKYRVGKAMQRLEPGPWFYNRPCGVYNTLLAPVLGYPADGLIWYQGESNTGNPSIYKTLFTRFAEHIRLHFGAGLPILFTQLANYIDPNGTGENWAALREQQRLCLSLSHTAMAVAIDCGEWNDLHPLDKKTVGHRLALNARRLVYREDIVSDGPTATRALNENGELVIFFDHAKGLWAKNGRPLIEAVDTHGNIRHFAAAIKGETLTARIGDFPVEKIRFGWSDNPPIPLYNAHNLPASPFEINVQI
jgi:sialate O-acetylesterase